MNDNDKELKALEAYLHLLKSKGAGADALAQRQQAIQQLIPLLKQLPPGDNLYRDAVEELMQQTDKHVWPTFLSVVREYYYFWINDIKTIASMLAQDDFDVAPMAAALQDESLEALWSGLDTEVFSVSEKWTLKAYCSALRDEGAEKRVVDTRSKLVKLLLIRLRGQEEKNARTYRTAVNKTLSLFGLRETRLLYLIVVREFFYFWIGDPEARSHIILDEVQQA